ncbi:MAG: DUF2834 domain-containing protein [Deltaproteobacteria bacterium]|nr:DUF2834 domain-containing protein [Deltaproteobacteria bacterium]
MPRSPRQWLYAALAVAGFLGTLVFNLRFAREAGGFDVLAFLAGGFANPAASSLATDLLVALVAFLVWSRVEARRLGMRRWWPYLALTFLVAFAVAYPLFLLARDRRLEALGAEGRPS